MAELMIPVAVPSESVLVRIDRTFRDVERLITTSTSTGNNDNYALARQHLGAINVNLERISSILSFEVYNHLKDCAQRLLDLCNNANGSGEVEESGTRSVAEAEGQQQIFSGVRLDHDSQSQHGQRQSAHLQPSNVGELSQNNDSTITTRQHGNGIHNRPSVSESASSELSFHAQRIISGRRGRPKVEITREQLLTLQKSGYSAKRIASHFHCSTSLVYKRLYAEGLKVRDKYSTLNDEELKNVIADLHEKFPNSGAEMMYGLLQSLGHTVQRKKVRQFLSEVDPPSAADRWGNAVSRRAYKVATPNSLWHMDGHMKLIRWGFVTHGCIDGFSRLVTFLKCSTKNHATTVLELFFKAVQLYSMPSRVRSDHGHENFLVALFMNMAFGTHRASHITGESVHNVRIERLWRDVYKDVITFYYTEFHALEDEGMLDPSDDLHKFSLHSVYLESINERLSTFQHAWNHHRIRTERNRTPEQIWRDGMLESSLDNTAVGRVFETEISWENVVEDMLRRYHLSDLTDDYEPQVDDTLRSRLSQMQKEELDLIVAGNGTLREKFMAHSAKVSEYLQL